MIESEDIYLYSHFFEFVENCRLKFIDKQIFSIYNVYTEWR